VERAPSDARYWPAKFKAAGGDQSKALLYWNGGGNKDYPGQVLDRVQKYEITTEAT